MAGNVFEWVAGTDDSGSKPARGGGYFFDRPTLAVPNQAALDPNLRGGQSRPAGVRV